MPKKHHSAEIEELSPPPAARGISASTSLRKTHGASRDGGRLLKAFTRSRSDVPRTDEDLEDLRAWKRARMRSGFQRVAGYYGGSYEVTRCVGSPDEYTVVQEGRRRDAIQGPRTLESRRLGQAGRDFLRCVPRTGVRGNRKKGALERFFLKLEGLDEDRIETNPKFQGYIWSDLDRVFQSKGELFALLEDLLGTTILHMPNLVVADIDEDGRVHRPHLLWLLPRNLHVWIDQSNPKCRRGPIALARMVTAALARGLAHLGADPTAPALHAQVKNPFSRIWQSYSLDETTRASLSNWSDLLDLTPVPYETRVADAQSGATPFWTRSGGAFDDVRFHAKDLAVRWMHEGDKRLDLLDREATAEALKAALVETFPEPAGRRAQDKHAHLLSRVATWTADHFDPNQAMARERQCNRGRLRDRCAAEHTTKGRRQVAAAYASECVRARSVAALVEAWKAIGSPDLSTVAKTALAKTAGVSRQTVHARWPDLMRAVQQTKQGECKERCIVQSHSTELSSSSSSPSPTSIDRPAKARVLPASEPLFEPHAGDGLAIHRPGSASSGAQVPGTVSPAPAAQMQALPSTGPATMCTAVRDELSTARARAIVGAVRYTEEEAWAAHARASQPRRARGSAVHVQVPGAPSSAGSTLPSRSARKPSQGGLGTGEAASEAKTAKTAKSSQRVSLVSLLSAWTAVVLSGKRPTMSAIALHLGVSEGAVEERWVEVQHSIVTAAQARAKSTPEGSQARLILRAVTDEASGKVGDIGLLAQAAKLLGKAATSEAEAPSRPKGWGEAAYADAVSRGATPGLLAAFKPHHLKGAITTALDERWIGLASWLKRVPTCMDATKHFLWGPQWLTDDERSRQCRTLRERYDAHRDGRPERPVEELIGQDWTSLNHAEPPAPPVSFKPSMPVFIRDEDDSDDRDLADIEAHSAFRRADRQSDYAWAA